MVVNGPDVSLIDFGFASHDGLRIPGGTAGFAPARQLRGEPPRDTDDLFALGMTLIYAAHSVPPVTLDGDRDAPRQRALQTISVQYGPMPSGIIGSIAALLSDDDDAARKAARMLAAGASGEQKPGAGRRVSSRLPTIVPFTQRAMSPVSHPVFVKDSPEEYGASWAFGVAGQPAHCGQNLSSAGRFWVKAARTHNRARRSGRIDPTARAGDYLRRPAA